MFRLIIRSAKKSKYPDGYPGDAPSKDTSKPVKYSCHKCSKVFPPVPNPASGKEMKQDCVRCGHERCSSCLTAPRVKVEPDPDPEIVKKVEAKLAALSVKSSAGA
jgi:DNA-directed RNA polymerase subunit RPC12/RpoP